MGSSSPCSVRCYAAQRGKEGQNGQRRVMRQLLGLFHRRELARLLSVDGHRSCGQGPSSRSVEVATALGRTAPLTQDGLVTA
jgi:hypothetical protein